MATGVRKTFPDRMVRAGIEAEDAVRPSGWQTVAAGSGVSRLNFVYDSDRFDEAEI
jgi:hypothetical protein